MFRQNVHMINFPHCSKGAKRVAVTHLVEQMIVVDLLYKEGMTVSEERGVHFENHIPQTQISKNVYLKKSQKSAISSSLVSILTCLFWEAIQPTSINSTILTALSH